jgi:diacylglycerol kinase (ATP)
LSQATLLYNPVAGGGGRRRETEIRRAAEVLRRAGFDLKIQRTSAAGSARKLAQAAAREGAETVIVCGGDGTINEVINGLAPGPCPLAILPGGTANIAAKELGLPHDPVAAARELAQARPRRIALGKATWGRQGALRPAKGLRDEHDPPPEARGEPLAQPSHRYFLSVAGVGFDAQVVRQVRAEFKTSAGVLAYGWAAVRQLWQYPFPRFLCQVGESEWGATFAAFLRAERYAGWLHLAPGASLLDGRMQLCLFESSHRWRYFVYAGATLLQQHRQLDDVRLFACEAVVVSAEDSSDRIYFELDGELTGELPATFELVPDALTLLVPSKSSG